HTFYGVFQRPQLGLEQHNRPTEDWSSGNSPNVGIEPTCYALMVLADDQVAARRVASDLLSRVQNPDGTWPALATTDPERCMSTVPSRWEWTTPNMEQKRQPRGPVLPLESCNVLYLKENKGAERGVVSYLMRSVSCRFNIANVPKIATVARAHCPKRP